MKKIYLAGSLFNDAEVAQRLKEGAILRSRFAGDVDVFNPIEQPFNDKAASLPTAQEIFRGDTKEVMKCDIFLADVSNPLDAGVFVELGIAMHREMMGERVDIICVNSDIRFANANKYDITPVGMNHYVLGGILDHGIYVSSFKEATDIIEGILEAEKNA